VLPLNKYYLERPLHTDRRTGKQPKKERERKREEKRREGERERVLLGNLILRKICSIIKYTVGN